MRVFFDMSDRSRSNGLTARVIAVVAVSLSLFQVWQPMAGFMPPGTIPFEDFFGMQPAVYFPSSPLAFYLGLGVVTLPS